MNVDFKISMWKTKIVKKKRVKDDKKIYGRMCLARVKINSDFIFSSNREKWKFSYIVFVYKVTQNTHKKMNKFRSWNGIVWKCFFSSRLGVGKNQGGI